MNRWTSTTTTGGPAVTDFSVGAVGRTEAWPPPQPSGVPSAYINSVATAPEYNANRDFSTAPPPPPNHQPTRFISSAAYLDSLSARPMASSSTGYPQWDEPRREPAHWSTGQPFSETPLTYAAHDASTMVQEAQLSEQELRANLSYLESVTALERNIDAAALQVDASVAALPDTSNAEFPWGTPSLQHQLDESDFATSIASPAAPTIAATTASESVPTTTTARSSFWGASSPWNGNTSPLGGGSSSYLCAISRQSSRSF
jgi:hypothetical protein